MTDEAAVVPAEAAEPPEPVAPADAAAPAEAVVPVAVEEDLSPGPPGEQTDALSGYLTETATLSSAHYAFLESVLVAFDRWSRGVATSAGSPSLLAAEFGVISQQFAATRAQVAELAVPDGASRHHAFLTDMTNRHQALLQDARLALGFAYVVQEAESPFLVASRNSRSLVEFVDLNRNLAQGRVMRAGASVQTGSAAELRTAMQAFVAAIEVDIRHLLEIEEALSAEAGAGGGPAFPPAIARIAEGAYVLDLRPLGAEALSAEATPPVAASPSPVGAAEAVGEAAPEAPGLGGEVVPDAAGDIAFGDGDLQLIGFATRSRVQPGESTTVIVRLLRGSATGVAGALVSVLDLSEPPIGGPGSVSDELRTDQSGQALFTFTGTVPGEHLLLVSTTVGESTIVVTVVIEVVES